MKRSRITDKERLVLIDAFNTAWAPWEKLFMTEILTLEDLGGGKTKYTAAVRHGTVADREAHEQMGLHTGWAQRADQLAGLVAKI
jgi:uncharacterized protein YndB with AHSA1/START domain